jgi:hypothetical protein
LEGFWSLVIPDEPGYSGRPAKCLKNGPFKDITLHIGPFGLMVPNKPRCLTRSLNAIRGELAVTKQKIRNIMQSKDLTNLTYAIGSFNSMDIGRGQHIIRSGRNFNPVGHAGVGGEVLHIQIHVTEQLLTREIVK